MHSITIILIIGYVVLYFTSERIICICCNTYMHIYNIVYDIYIYAHMYIYVYIYIHIMHTQNTYT